MAKKDRLPHWGSKGAINRAGEALRRRSVTSGQTLCLESWRIAHRYVIHSFEALLRARAKQYEEVEVAQRLKRRTTIVDKLSRYPRMELARMDDIAGCRVIFPTVESLHDYRNKVHKAKFKHLLRNEKGKYDYLLSPTDRGYRGIHDVYEYRARQKKPTYYNGLMIEIQYRTQVQHAWATAVELVTQLTENEPKFNRGDPRHIRLFVLASEMLARAHEAMNSCLAEIGNKELVEEFDSLNEELQVMQMFFNLHLHKWADEEAKAKKAAHVILQLNTTGDLTYHHFDLELEASRALLELEKANPEDDIVLVGASTAKEIASAFRNYFRDVGAFIGYIGNARDLLLIGKQE